MPDRVAEILSRLREIELSHPWFLLAALPAWLIIFWRARRKRSVPALLYPSVRSLKDLPRTLRQRLLFVLPCLEAVAALLLAGAAARPRLGNERSVIRSQGIAIQLVLDRSGSMEEEMEFDGRTRKRIDIVKEVFTDFVVGDEESGGDLRGRKTDLVGLTTFARFTEESCPLVARHEPLVTAVKRLQTVPPLLDRYGRPRAMPRNDAEMARAQRDLRSGALQQNPLNATAIGDGLFRAVLSLVAAEEEYARGEEEGGFKLEGKVAILLTDGENNAGDVDPVEAGRYARENGVRVYYILLREPYEMQQSFFSRAIRREIPRDTLLETPREVAGDRARAFLAEDGDALRRIYEEIDRLERSEIGKLQYLSHDELYLWLLVPGFVAALLAILLSETIFRRVP